MTRTVASEAVVLRPTNNVYTVLAIGATLVQVVGLILLFLFATDQVGGLF
jgi:hypothetical protein